MQEQLEFIAMSICMGIGLLVSVKNWKSGKNRKTKHQRFIEKAEREGSYTTAVAYESQVLLGHRDSDNPDLRRHRRLARYRYTVNGKDYTMALAYPNTGGVIPDYDPTITVYYNPRNPDEWDIMNSETEFDRRKKGCLTSIGIFFLVTLGLFALIKFLLGW